MSELKLIQINDYVYINPDSITAIDIDLKRVYVSGKDFHYNYLFEKYLNTLGIKYIKETPEPLGLGI